MMMYSFRNDYSEGAHPSVMAALEKTNMVQTVGYGTDPFCEEARELIREKCAAPNADVHFLMGGTQVNLLACAAFLRPFEAVISPCSGHPLVHETGALEATGHMVIPVPSEDGKLRPEQVRTLCTAHSGEHMVRPRLVYISNATELGTAYTKEELSALHNVCKELNLYIYADGARMGNGMVSDSAPLTFEDLAETLDAFTIGGTKNGLLLGEALVITNPALKADFRSHMKQRGAMMAKGRVLGIQFKTILENDQYLENARHANRLAQKMQADIEALGYSFLIKSPTNQIFPIFPNTVLAELEKLYAYEVQQIIDDTHTCIRLVTSWATPEEVIPAFAKDLAEITEKCSI